MPFTPFHFGAHACVALPLSKRINFLTFVLANIIIDIEPLLVMLFNLDYPLHGYAHTFIGAALIGALWGLAAHKSKGALKKFSQLLKLPSDFTKRQYVFSGVSGTLLHVVFDAPIYSDIRPFFPLKINPLFGLISAPSMYKICAFLFLPAVILYIFVFQRNKQTIR